MLEIDFSHSDEELRRILETSRVVAMVGESNDHYYTSYQVAQYLKEMGYQVYPVNPRIPDVDGEHSYPSLADVPEPIDIVDAAIAVRAKPLCAIGRCFEQSGTGAQGEGGRNECGLEPLHTHRARTAAIRPKMNLRIKEERLFN